MTTLSTVKRAYAADMSPDATDAQLARQVERAYQELEEDTAAYRYHPLLLNAAFLGDLSAEDQRILGFGEKAQYRRAYVGRSAYQTSGKLFQSIHGVNLIWRDYSGRVWRRLRRLVEK